MANQNNDKKSIDDQAAVAQSEDNEEAENGQLGDDREERNRARRSLESDVSSAYV